MENVVQFLVLAGFCQHFCVLTLSKFVELAVKPSGCCQISWYLKIWQHFLKNMLAKSPGILKMYNIDMIRHSNTSKMTRLFFKMLSFFLYLRFLPTSKYFIISPAPDLRRSSPGARCLTSGVQCPTFSIMNQTPTKDRNQLQLNYDMVNHSLAEYAQQLSLFLKYCNFSWVSKILQHEH